MDNLKSKPCTDCGSSFNPWQMHWDHLRDKEFNISSGMFRYSWERVLLEIAKCELVCANCHADRTYKRNAGIVLEASTYPS